MQYNTLMTSHFYSSICFCFVLGAYCATLSLLDKPFIAVLITISIIQT